jgi:hypothetical protein
VSSSVKITAPVKGFQGEVAGVVFSKGVGEVDSGNAAALAYFRRKGYGIDGDSVAPTPTPQVDAATAPIGEPAPTPAEPGAPVPDDAFQQVREGVPVGSDIVPPPPPSGGGIAQQPPPASSATPAAGYDPAEHTVAEVQKYLADATEDERARVLSAEKSGKARKQLVGE